MNADDILFAPILPPEAEEKLRNIIRRVMAGPRNDDSFTNQVTHEIVELLTRHGFTDHKEIGEIVGRIIKELGGP
jgi:hypothetical protein